MIMDCTGQQVNRRSCSRLWILQIGLSVDICTPASVMSCATESMDNSSKTLSYSRDRGQDNDEKTTLIFLSPVQVFGFSLKANHSHHSSCVASSRGSMQVMSWIMVALKERIFCNVNINSRIAYIYWQKPGLDISNQTMRTLKLRRTQLVCIKSLGRILQ